MIAIMIGLLVGFSVAGILVKPGPLNCQTKVNLDYWLFAL
jgi:hypothetical protein